MFKMSRLIGALGVAAACGCTALVLGLTATASSAASSTAPPGLMSQGTLTVGMSLQNLAFAGLIPGLQTKKFDLVSVGLSPTPARQKVISFTKAYVPYVQVVGIPAKDAKTVTSIAALNKPGNVITALLGSTAQDKAKQVFPKAKIQALSDQNSDFSLVATGRANAIVVEDYLLAQYSKANPGKLVQSKIKPLDVQYGSYAVQKGNTALISYLNKFLCTESKNGTLEKLYKKDFGTKTFVGVPAC